MWCRYCNENTKEQGEENFKRCVEEKEVTIIGKYNGNHNQILVRCKLGHGWEILPYNLSQEK
jgi:hypothetical protein